MKISFNCTDDQQVVHTHKDAGLSDQVPCSKPDISPEAYLNDYRNRMPFHYIEEGSDGYYYWQYGSIMDLVINFVDEIAQSEDMPEAVLDVRIDDKSVVDPVTGVAHLGSMAVHDTANYYTLQQVNKIVGGLSQQIKDLQEGAVASVVDSSENLMSGQLLMWDSEARRLVGSPLVKGDAEKSIILKTSSSDPNFASHEGAVLLGKGLRSSFPYQFVTGYYNKLIPEQVFSVGTGFSDEARSTAFSISRSGKVKVFTSPVDKDDIVRKEELDAVKVIADKAVVANEPITAGTHTKITYDAKGLVIGGSNLTAYDIPELPTSKITSGTFSDDRIASANTWNAKQDALTTQQLSAVNSGITSEKVAAYDGYAETINEKLDKSGGTISGSLVVSENLVVSGTTSTVHTQNLKVTDKLIYVAKDNTTPLTSPAGLITPKYDGINNGGIVYDNTGTAYVGDITLDSNGNVDVNNSDLQPIATRDAAITDGNIVKWDDTNKTLVDSGKALSDLATKEDLQEVSNSNLLYNSDFGIHGSINGPTSGDTIPGWYSGGGYSYVKYDTTKKSVYIRQLYNASYGGPLLSQDLSPSNAYSYPRDFIGGKTFTLSAEFEDINDAGEYELRLIFRPVSNSASDVIHSTPIKNGRVSVTATAPEKSDFGIVAQVYATKGIGVAHKTLMFINYVKLEFGSQATPYLPPLRQEEVWKNTELLTYRKLGYNHTFNSVSDDKVLSEEALNFYFAKITDVNAKSFTKVYKSVSDLGLKNGASVIDVIKKMSSNKSLAKLVNVDSNSNYYISGCPVDNGILTIYRGPGALNYIEITYQQFISDNNVSNIYTGYPVYSNNTITDIVWHLIENTANKTTTVGPDSTDDQYPTAKAVYDALPKIEIIDNLNSTAADKALSANQGRILNEMMGGVEARLTNLENNTYVDLTTLSDNPSTMSTRATTYGLARSADITYTELQVGQSISRVKFDITKSTEEMDAWLNSLVFPADDNILVLAADDAEGSIISAQIMDAAGTKALCFGSDGIAYATNDIAEAGISHGWIVGQFDGFNALDENGVGLLLDQNNETASQIGMVNTDVSGWNGVFITAGLNENASSGSTENVMTQFAVGESITSFSFNPNLTTEQIQQKIQEIQSTTGQYFVEILGLLYQGETRPAVSVGNFDQIGEECIQFLEKILWSAKNFDNLDGIKLKEGWQDSFSVDLEDPSGSVITFAWDKSTLTFSFTTSFDISSVIDSFNGSVFGKDAIASEGTELHNIILPSATHGIPYETFTMPVRDSNGTIITENSERTLDFTVKVNETEVHTGTLTYSNNIEGATGYMNDSFALLLNYYYDSDTSTMISAPGTANFVMLEMVSSDVTVILESIYKKASTATQYGTIESGTNIDSLQFDTGFDVETFLRAQDYSSASAIPLIEATANGETATLLRVFHDVNDTGNPELYELLIAETTVYSTQSGWQRLDENNAVHLPTLLSEYGLSLTSVYINSVYTVNGEEWNGTLVKARVGDSNSESGGGNTETGNSITQTDAGYEVSYTNGKVLLPFRFGGNLNAYIENNKINVEAIPDNNYDSLGNLPIVNTNLREQYFYPETNRYYRHTGETGTKDVSNSLNIGEAINSIKFNTGYDIDNFVRSIPYDGSGTCNLLYVGADAPAAMETGVSVTKFKFYRDYDQLDTFLSGLDYSGLADGEPRMLVRVDDGNYEIAAFKIGTAYMLGYMESGSGIIVYSTAEVTEHNVVQGWQNLNDDNLINASGNITAVYTNDTSWIGNIVDAISYQSNPFLIAIYNSNDGSYSLGSMLEDRIWDTTSGWQNLDENGVYNFSEKLQAALGVSELPITEIADHNGWNGNLAMKNEPVSTDSTVFINGVIYFYDGSTYKAINGESDKQEILDVSHGGTGVASFNNNNSLVLTGDSPTSNLTTLPNGPEGYVLKSNGPEAIPSWIPSTEISSKSVYVLNLSAEGSVTALQARQALEAFNSGKSVICQMPGFLTATLMSVVLPETSSTGNTVMTFLADIGDTVIKFTLDLPSNAADSDELTFNQTEFGSTDITIATASDIDTIIL